MKTKNQAIKYARANVGELYYCGGQYRFNYFEPSCDAWRASTPRCHAAAQSYRAQKLIDFAREALNLEPLQYDGGKWTDYLN